MKKKIISPLFFLLLFIAITNVFAQRILEIEGGNVQGYWQDTVIVHGNITLLENDTLIIEQGTLILFDQDIHFLVFGKLEAVGSDNMPIIFRNNNLEQWNGIHFRGIVPEFEYCHFIHTKDDPAYALKGAVSFKAGIEGIPPIRHCFFKENAGGALYFKTVINYNENIEITQNVFDVTEKFAVQIKSCAFDSLKLINNQMASSNPEITTKGIIVEHDCVCTFILMEDNQLTGFNVLPEDDGGAAVQIDSIPYASMLFKHNQFLNNHGIKAGGINIQGANLVVFTGENRFENNTGISGAAAITCNEITVDNNMFIGNHNPDGANGGGAITLVLDAGGSGYFQNNTFDNNDASGFFVDGGCITVTNIGSGSIHNLFFIENTFVNSDIQGNGGAIAVNCFELAHLSVKENSFRNLEAGLNGGCIKLNSVEKVAFIDILNNSADTCKANGKGGFSYFSFLNNDSITISQNDFTFCRTPFADGGVNYMNANSIGEFSFDNNNFLNCNTKGGNGGVVCIEAMQTGNIKFLHNKAEDTLFSKNSGGFLYINCENEMESIQISQNEFTTCIAGEGSGGGVYLSSGSIGSFYVSNNKITDLATSAQGNGGFLFLESSGQISSIHFTENEIAKSHAGINGGIASILLSNMLTSFTFDGNIFGETAADSSGGTIYLNCPAVDNFTFTNNVINTQSIAADRGGCLCLAIDNTIGEINFAFNNLNKCQADNGSGGTLFVSTQSCNNFSATSNTINGQTNANGGSGGFVFLDCSSSSGDILFDNNLIGGAFAHNNGGYVFIQSPQTGNISFTNETANQSVIAENGNGGFVYIHTKPLSYVQMSNNQVGQNSQSGIHGGFLYLSSPNGEFDSLIFHENSIHSCLAGGEGGTLFAVASSIGFVNLVSNNISGYSQAEFNGGFACLNIFNSIDSIYFNNNNIQSSASATGKGGVLFLENTDLGKTTISYNTINTSASALQDGGFVYLNCSSQMGDILFTNNIIGDAFAGENGGYAFIQSPQTGNILFYNETVNQSTIAQNGTGGFVSINADPLSFVQVSSIHVSQNSQSGSKGGFVYLNTSSTLDSLILTDNSINSCSANGEGGTLYTEAKAIQFINIQSNSIAGSSEAELNGGFVYISLNNDIDSLQLSGNNINTTTSIDGKGGGLYCKARDIRKIIITDNLISSSAFAQQDGGFVFFDARTIVDFMLGSNQINNVSECGGSGGLAHITLSNLVEFFRCNDNTLSEASAGASGGTIYLVSPQIIHVEFTNNQISSKTYADDDGGCLYISSLSSLGSLDLTGNNLTTCEAGNGSGGTLYLEATSGSIIAIASNKIIGSTSANGGSGGFLYIGLTENLPEINVVDNIINKSTASQNGGYLFLSGQNLEVVNIENEIIGQTSEAVAGDGGFTFIECDTLGELTCSNISINKSWSGGSGGVAHIHPGITVGSLFFENININESEAVGSGGVIYIDSETDIHSFQFRNSTIQSSVAGNDGGCIYVNSHTKTESVIIINNIFRDFTSLYGNGGCLFIQNGVKPNSSVFVNNSSFIRQSEFGSYSIKGGGIYVKTCDSLFVSDSEFNSLISQQGGGALYAQDINVALLPNDLTFKSNFSGYAPDNTITFNNAQGGAIYATEVGSLLIDNAQFVNNISSLSGGAIYVQDIDTLDIQNSKFTRNIGFNIHSVNNESKGGGLFFDNLIQANISLNYFTGNSSFRGGALFGYDSELLINDNFFSKNEAWYGAGLYLENCSDETKRNYIFNNKANFSGGGIYLKRSDNDPGYLIVDSNMVINNFAKEGGGIYSNNSADRFSRNHIGLNQCTLSTSNENQGGGVFLSKNGAGSDFYNCLIYSNQIIRSEKPGSGIFIDPDGSNPDDQTDIINCTIFNNSHYGIFQDTLNETDISKCQIQNSLIWGNNAKRISDQVNFNENIESFYSDVYGAVEGPPYHNLNGLNPIFVGSTNLNLRADTVFYSPCIDHGDPLPEYFDQYFPPSYGSDTNDIGATGGPMAVNDSLFYVLQSAQYLLDSISIEIQASNCLAYSFTVWPDNPDLEYTWITNNQVISGGQNLSYEYPDYGNYTVCVYAESVIGGSLFTDMICKTIEISPPPYIYQLYDCQGVVSNDTLWVDYNDTPVDSTITICANFSGSFDEPHWSVNPEGSGTITSFSDSTCQVLLSPIEFYQEQITITYFVENSCGSDEKSFVFVLDTIAKGPDYINEQGFQNLDVNIYPNPASEAFYLELRGPEVGNYVLLLFNTGNQLVFKSQFDKTAYNQRVKVDVGSLPKGIYTGKVFNNKGITVFKIVIH